jgi:pimeloyl-ACP methyl ester carboxylesterase
MDHFLRPGLRFDVVDSGPADAPAVVLLHGFPQQPSTFQAVADRLNAEGLRTLTPSQRGYTRAARPSRRRDYRTAATAADVIALLDTAGLAQAHIVGHDWGGNQAWGAAGWHPDRVASLTVLSTPHPMAFRKALLTSKQGLVSWYMGLFQLPAVPEWRPAGRVRQPVRRGDERARRAHRSSELVSRASVLWTSATRPDHRADDLHLGPE